MASMLLMLPLLTGCIIPKGYRSKEKVVAERLDEKGTVVESLVQKSVRFTAVLPFTPEGPALDYTLSEKQKYFFQKPGGERLHLKFLDAKGQFGWQDIGPISATNLWIALNCEGIDSKARYGSSRIVVFDSRGIVFTQSLRTFDDRIQLLPGNRLVRNWVSDADYDTYSFPDDVIIPDRYRKAESNLQLRVTSATLSVNKPEMVSIALQLSAQGETPIALSQEQFTVRFAMYGFDLKPVFSPETPPVVLLNPGQPLELKLTFTPALWKPQLKQIGVWVNSTRHAREFDYQWLAESHSNLHEIE